MIDQSFVECRPVLGAKFLYTFNTKCVSASMKQHGIGIVGSAINASYNLLGKVGLILSPIGSLIVLGSCSQTFSSFPLRRNFNYLLNLWLMKT